MAKRKKATTEPTGDSATGCGAECEHDRILHYNPTDIDSIKRLTLCATHARERDAAMVILERNAQRQTQSYDANQRPTGPSYRVARAVSRLEARILIETGQA